MLNNLEKKWLEYSSILLLLFYVYKIAKKYSLIQNYWWDRAAWVASRLKLLGPYWEVPFEGQLVDLYRSETDFYIYSIIALISVFLIYVLCKNVIKKQFSWKWFIICVVFFILFIILSLLTLGRF
jgi:hypothetical protein